MRKTHDTAWSKLDNTANLFPVIATEDMSNVYRISATLKEEIEPELLKEALDKVLPRFGSMSVRLRTGVFWYYFESNKRKAPTVTQENECPCRFIEPRENRYYLFRVTYFGCRINLEIFHVLSDGMGGVNFLRELVYAYLRLKHPELAKETGEGLSAETSLDTEDSYVKNFKHSQPKGYRSEKAFQIKGEHLGRNLLRVTHGFISVSELKKITHERGISINEYLASVYVYSIYKEYIHGGMYNRPIVLCIPVNLRPYFDSMTTRNFFAMVSTAFHMQKEDYSREEITDIVVRTLRQQITKENLEKLFSYNVANQKNLMLRMVPLVIKKLAIKWVYFASADATTTTMTNVGNIQVQEAYRNYIDYFSVIIAPSRSQEIKGAVCSYGDELVFTFSSMLKDTFIEKRFFRTIVEDGISVRVATNGVGADLESAERHENSPVNRTVNGEENGTEGGNGHEM